jgi:hypothetical protein
MKKLIGFMFLLMASYSYSATYYCDAPKWNAETKFEGDIGAAGAAGTLLYFGPNPGDAETEGTYQFETATKFKMYFEGEPVHICDQWKPKQWYCKMGKWFWYKLNCDF